LFVLFLICVFFRCSEVKRQTAGEEKTADIYQCTRNCETNVTPALPKLDHNKLKMLLLYGLFFKQKFFY
jgi:hypothetical protein